MKEKNYKYMVNVRCFAYNQEKYIRKCLEGFIMQKTTFKFKVVVHDDASTDNTATIIKEFADKYPTIIVPIFETENQYSKRDGSLGRIMREQTLDAKYIAFCEADDYWTDPYKLQKQVDFLEANPEYGMCYTRVQIYNQHTHAFERKPFGGPSVSFSELVKDNSVPSLSVLRRTSVEEQYVLEGHNKDKGWTMGDYPRWLWYACTSKIKFLPDITGVYRVLDKSASHSPNVETKEKFVFQTYEIIRYFSNYFGKKECYDEQRLYKSLHNNAVLYGDLKRERAYYQKIVHPEMIRRIKHLICSHDFLYDLFANKLFTSLKRQ